MRSSSSQAKQHTSECLQPSLPKPIPAPCRLKRFLVSIFTFVPHTHCIPRHRCQRFLPSTSFLEPQTWASLDEYRSHLGNLCFISAFLRPFPLGLLNNTPCSDQAGKDALPPSALGERSQIIALLQNPNYYCHASLSLHT